MLDAFSIHVFLSVASYLQKFTVDDLCFFSAICVQTHFKLDIYGTFALFRLFPA
jgi:hypothetical protein